MGLLDMILKPLLTKLIAGILDKIKDPANIRNFAEMILDAAENFAAKTKTPVDDVAVSTIRKILNMPDLPD